ncbi:MAG: SpoIIE family protein phosphatase, partial [bacterium]
RPATEVGGDLVDYIKLDGAGFGIALADVSGKGLSAALLAAKLQATLRAVTPGYASLDALGSKLNQIFCRDNLKNYFASLLYFDVQHNSGDVRVLNAGHPPPLLIKGKHVETMHKGGVALGIMPGGVFTEQRIHVDIGEFIVAYSDGLTEARNEAGEFFGDERLLALSSSMADCSAEEAGAMLFEKIDRFVGEAKVHDDLSIVVLKRVQNS